MNGRFASLLLCSSRGAGLKGGEMVLKNDRRGQREVVVDEEGGKHDVLYPLLDAESGRIYCITTSLN